MNMTGQCIAPFRKLLEYSPHFHLHIFPLLEEFLTSFLAPFSYLSVFVPSQTKETCRYSADTKFLMACQIFVVQYQYDY